MSAGAIQSVAVGRATDDRTRIARALLMLLEGLTRRQGRYLESLDFYQGEIGDNDALDQVLTKLRGRCPAVLVSVGGSDYESKSVNKRSYMVTYRVELAVISRHWGSMEARAEGGPDRFVEISDPGVYAILHDVRGKLTARNLQASGSNSPVPQGDSIVLQTNDMVIFQSRYDVGMSYAQTRTSNPTPVKAESGDVDAQLLVEQEQ